MKNEVVPQTELLNTIKHDLPGSSVWTSITLVSDGGKLFGRFAIVYGNCKNCNVHHCNETL